MPLKKSVSALVETKRMPRQVYCRKKRGLGKDALREIIWNERRIELAFEGNRWFDLVRYEKVVPNYTTNLMHRKGRTNFDYAKHSKFPIPTYYITSSEGVLTQNPAWQ